ncbi:hypothetical protein b3_0176 [Synechococcus phage B3]|nr:hypothetical protein b3_0176 [Synechococcus phage B3]QGT54790.1 hypothetical protein b23_0175 [Synechococcus phage B23]
MLTGNDLLEKVKELREPTDKISTIELLNFIYKLHDLNAIYSVSQDATGYWYTVYYDWYIPNDFVNIKLRICKDGTCEEFICFNDLLDIKLKERQESDIRESKRRKLMASLSKEEKELLGLK